jgi:hypothetical protein
MITSGHQDFDMISLWEILCENPWRGGYRRILLAKGYKTKEIADIFERFSIIINWLKNPAYKRLQEIDSKEEFKIDLKKIFDGFKEGQYKDMLEHFLGYIDIIDTLEAIHGEFYTVEEREKICKTIDPSAKELTHYETDFLEDGKLTALMYPPLLYLIGLKIRRKEIKMSQAKMICYLYYKDLLPAMTSNDASKLVDKIWDANGRIIIGSKNKRLVITFPDGTQTVTKGMDAVREAIKFYGPDAIFKRKVTTGIKGKGNLLILVAKNMVIPQQDKYVDYDNKYLILKTVGDYRNLLKLLNFINLPGKLHIDLTEGRS